MIKGTETGNGKIKIKKNENTVLRVSILDLHDNARLLELAKGTAKARYASVRRKRRNEEERRESR